MCRWCFIALVRFSENQMRSGLNQYCVKFSSHLPIKLSIPTEKGKNNKDFMCPSFKMVCKTVNGLHDNSANCKVQ